MTKDEFDNKLIEMGVKKVQLDSNLYIQMVALFGDYLTAKDAQAIIRKMRTDLERKEIFLKEKEDNIECRIEEMKKERKALEEKEDEILQMETAEARDKIRLACYFENSISIENSYQQTEYIKGLANILSGKVDNV